MSLLFNTLYRFVIVILSRSKHLLILWLQSLSALILEPRKWNLTVSIVSPSICHGMIGPDATILAFWMLRFKPAFFTLLFHFTRRLLSSSLLSAIKVVSSADLRWLLFHPAILIPVCDSCRLAFWMMYSGYKLNKHGDYIQSCHIIFPILNQSVVPCLVLTVASWLAYRFLRRQVR